LSRKIPDPNDNSNMIPKPALALGTLLETYLSCFPVFTGNGMTLTHTNKYGVREWFLHLNPDKVIKSEMEKPPFNLIKTKETTIVP
jgi:hypothetical protein